MPKSFGVEQEVDIGSVPGAGGTAPMVSPIQHTADVTDTIRSVGMSVSKWAKDAEQRSLGADIASANERLGTITNPVERRLAEDKLRNVMMTKHGANAIGEINAGMSKRKIKQIYEGGMVHNIDEDSGAILSSFQPHDMGEEIQRRELTNLGTFQAEMPNTSDVGSAFVQAAKGSGAEIGMEDLSSFTRAANNTVLAAEEGLYGRFRMMRQSDKITMQAVDDYTSDLVRDVTAKAYNTILQLNSVDMNNAVKKMGPDAGNALVGSVVNDLVANLTEQGFFKQTNTDPGQFIKTLNEFGDNVRTKFKASFENNAALIKQTDDIIAARTNIRKNEIYLKMDPKLQEMVVAGPAVTAIATVAQAGLLGDAYTKFGDEGQRKLTRVINKVIEGDSYNTSNVARLQRYTDFTSKADLADALNLTREVLGSPEGTLHYKAVLEYWDKNKKTFAEAAKKQGVDIEPVYSELAQYRIDLNSRLSAHGKTEADLDKDIGVLQKIMQTLMPAKTRPRPVPEH